jgi:sarcosine oxidase
VTWDVGIIGIGTMGSMAAWQLARMGVSVIGFEQFGIGHDRSGAGGESRLFRTAYKEGAEYVPLLLQSKELWRQLEQETQTQLLTLNGGLTIGHPDDDVIKNVQQSINEFELEHDILDYQQAATRYPQHLLLKEEVMILDKNAGYIRPELAVVSAASRAKELGANILSYTGVESIEQVGDKIRLTARGKQYKVEKLLITAGPWLSKLVPAFRSFVTAKKIILTWFPATDIRRFHADQFPVFTRTTKGIRFFGAPTLENSMVKVGVSNAVSLLEDADNLDRTVGLDEMKESLSIVKKYFLGLKAEPVRASAYMDAYTTDDHSIIGSIPNLANTYVLGGFSGHGFKMAPALGKLAANILLDQPSTFQIDQLNPNRFITSI